MSDVLVVTTCFVWASWFYLVVKDIWRKWKETSGPIYPKVSLEPGAAVDFFHPQRPNEVIARLVLESIQTGMHGTTATFVDRSKWMQDRKFR